MLFCFTDTLSLSLSQDLLSILPIVDSIMLLELTGHQLLEALENGVSQYPKHEGRFPQVSGISFSFDPTQPGGHRITMDNVFVGGAPVQEDMIYKLCTKGYIGQHGKDGYDVFRHCKRLVPEDEGPILFSMIRDHFETRLKLSLNSEGVDGGDSGGSRYVSDFYSLLMYYYYNSLQGGWSEN